MALEAPCSHLPYKEPKVKKVIVNMLQICTSASTSLFRLKSQSPGLLPADREPGGGAMNPATFLRCGTPLNG